MEGLVPLPKDWRERWHALGDAEVLCVEGERLSGIELDRQTEGVSGGLRVEGVGFGDRVVWEARCTLASVVAALSVIRMGAILVPVNERQSDAEREAIMTAVTPVLVIGEPRASHPVDLAVVTPEEIAFIPYTCDAVTFRDPALIIFTSGTTGNPKGAVVTHGNLQAQCAALIEAWHWTHEDRLLSALPLFHVHGLVVACFTALVSGGSLVLRSQFDAEDFLTTMGEESATMAFCVPTMLQRCITSPHIEAVAALRLLVSGSAPLSKELFARYEDLGVTILERYGMTESLLTFSNPIDGERRSGTVGFALPGVDAILPEPGGGEAELRVKGPGVFAGYWNNPEATEAVMKNGWLATGDIVRLDQDGYLIISGRSKELIITGGFNVFPGEVEEVLLAEPTIRDAAVVGRAHDDLGEEIVAYVVVGDDFDEEKVRTHLRGQMSAYKVPRRFVTIDELPRNHMGKIQRHLLS